MTIYLPGAPVPIFHSDSANLDAFSRLRTSDPVGLFSSKMLYDNAPLTYDDQQTSGASTSSTYNNNQASVTLSATGNVAGTRIRQSFRRFNYQPGRSQLVALTGIIAATGAAAAGITRRIGQFDGYNGFFFQYGGTPGDGYLSVGIRTYTSGSAVDTLIIQSSWNIDKMNGSGPSGITLDVTKAQIFIIDYQWLGVGRIRYGFDINGVIYYVHQITPANNQALVSISTPNNPIRYEIISNGAGSAATATLIHICASVVSEGGGLDVGYPISINSSTTAFTTNNSTNIFPIIALQLQSNKLGATVDISSVTVTSTTANAQLLFQIYLNPTLTGTALSYSAITNSVCQYSLGTTGTTVSGGTIIHQEFISNRSGTSLNVSSFGVRTLGTYINNTSETLVFAISSVPAASNAVYMTVNWREAH
jgi:hypothetical protein